MRKYCKVINLELSLKYACELLFKILNRDSYSSFVIIN